MIIYKIFLEVGARGPRSQDVRNIVSKYSKYLGTDIGKDNNVDIICDAHKLSSEIDINSIESQQESTEGPSSPGLGCL